MRLVAKRNHSPRRVGGAGGRVLIPFDYVNDANNMFLHVCRTEVSSARLRGMSDRLGGIQMVKVLKARLKLEYLPVEDVPLALVKALSALAEAERVLR